jgi:hypothetical protein
VANNNVKELRKDCEAINVRCTAYCDEHDCSHQIESERAAYNITRQMPACLDEIDRLRALLVEACDLADEGWAYAGDYFRDKWRCEERLSTLRNTGTGETK